MLVNDRAQVMPSRDQDFGENTEPNRNEPRRRDGSEKFYSKITKNSICQISVFVWSETLREQDNNFFKNLGKPRYKYRAEPNRAEIWSRLCSVNLGLGRTLIYLFTYAT